MKKKTADIKTGYMFMYYTKITDIMNDTTDYHSHEIVAPSLNRLYDMVSEWMIEEHGVKTIKEMIKYNYVLLPHPCDSYIMYKVSYITYNGRDKVLEKHEIKEHGYNKQLDKIMRSAIAKRNIVKAAKNE